MSFWIGDDGVKEKESDVKNGKGSIEETSV